MSSTTSTAQTAQLFNLEELCKANEREFLRRGGRIINLLEGTPDTHKSSVFQCTSQIRARITPQAVSGLYILDFINNNGERIEGRTGLVVFDGKENNPKRYMMKPVWRNISPYSTSELELYYLHPFCLYEICLRDTQQRLKTITFPVTNAVRCI